MTPAQIGILITVHTGDAEPTNGQTKEWGDVGDLLALHRMQG